MANIEKNIINQMKQSDEGLFKPDSGESKLDIIDTMLDGVVRAGSFGMIDLPIIRKSVKKYFDENPKHYEVFSKSIDMMLGNPLSPYHMINGMKSLFNKVMSNIEDAGVYHPPEKGADPKSLRDIGHMQSKANTDQWEHGHIHNEGLWNKPSEIEFRNSMGNNFNR